MTDITNILFVCVENAGRSQMAEAFFKKYAPKKFNVISAGTTPSSQLNPLSVKVMTEIGIDLNDQQPKLLTNNMIESSFKTINMGCMDKESCPSLFIKEVLDLNISHPNEKSIDEVRKIRGQIKTKMMSLIDSLEQYR